MNETKKVFMLCFDSTWQFDEHLQNSWVKFKMREQHQTYYIKKTRAKQIRKNKQ